MLCEDSVCWGGKSPYSSTPFPLRGGESVPPALEPEWASNCFQQQNGAEVKLGHFWGAFKSHAISSCFPWNAHCEANQLLYNKFNCPEINKLVRTHVSGLIETLHLESIFQPAYQGSRHLSKAILDLLDQHLHQLNTAEWPQLRT